MPENGPVYTRRKTMDYAARELFIMATFTVPF